jgi:transposase
MGQVVVVGLDIAKSVFQVHGVDRDGGVVVRRRLGRSRVLPFFATVEPCRIGIEACANGTIGHASWACSGTMSG